MTIAFDAFTHLYTGAATSSGGTHTPAGTPRAVIVTISQHVTGNDYVTSVTYGGVAMTRAAFCENTGDLTNYPSCEYIYFLGSGIPTGAQTVTVSMSTGVWHTVDCFTYTAGNDTEVQNTGTLDTYHKNPTTTLSLSGKSCAVVMGGHSGNHRTNYITALSGWTERYEYDYGDDTGFTYSYNTIAAADVTWGLTTTEAQPLAAAAIAITETPSDSFNPRINFL